LTFVTEIENKYTFNDNQDNTCNDFIFLFPNTCKENTAPGGYHTLQLLLIQVSGCVSPKN